MTATSPEEREPIRLTLLATLDTIEGSGGEITFNVNGHRALKSGRVERYQIVFQACRFSVAQLQREIRKMHIRDRERLAMEAKRIEREIRELTTEG